MPGDNNYDSLGDKKKQFLEIFQKNFQFFKQLIYTKNMETLLKTSEVVGSNSSATDTLVTFRPISSFQN